MKSSARAAAGGALLVGLIGFAGAAPVTFNTALPVGTGHFVARILIVASDSDDGAGVNRRAVQATSVVGVLGCGATSKLALFAVLPYADRSLNLAVDGERVDRGASGIGDVSVFARYTVVQHDEPGHTFRIAPFAGIEAPTGPHRRRDRFGRLPGTLQPGSGGWDYFGGVVATRQTTSLQLDGQFSYRRTGSADGIDPGDEWRLDGSLQYRLLPRVLGTGAPDFLYGVLEANLVHRGKTAIGDGRDGNTGGTTLHLAPGLQYVTKRWILEGIVQLPLEQNLNGRGLENDYMLRAGVRFNF